jgi:hypothetical protein
MKENELPEEDKESSGFEVLCGLTLAILAAILAITDIGGGRFGDDEIIAHNQKTNSFNWYQAKAVKESLIEGQRDMLKVMMDSGAIPAKAQDQMAVLMSTLNKEIDRYKKEKAELLRGSASVGESAWVVEQDGKLGQVKGALEWEQEAKKLGAAGDTFDLAVLFLQICLVMGAISLILKGERMRNFFYATMVGLGGLGSYFSAVAFLQVA